MALFPTHASTSLVLGGSYAAAAHLGYGMPLPSCLLAGGLCTIAGMLPDVDSDNAVIFREVLTFSAAITPMLLLDHFRSLGWDQESIVVASGLLYVIFRFGLGEVIRRTTVHRGMWHSVPAAAVASGIIYMLCACPDTKMRLFKASAVAVGYLWHLVLDEIYAVETGMLTVRKKKSFGTAFKFVGKNALANIAVYGMLVAVTAAILISPSNEHLAHGDDDGHGHYGEGNMNTPPQFTPMPPTNAQQPGADWQYQEHNAGQPATPYVPPYSPAPSYAPPYSPTPQPAPRQPTSSWHWNP